jgi:hypothetical protein
MRRAPHKHTRAACTQVLLVSLYLLLCGLYWAWSAAQLAAEARDVLDVKHFINNKLGISDRQVGADVAWCLGLWWLRCATACSPAPTPLHLHCTNALNYPSNLDCARCA